MSDELFTAETVAALSPRLRWIEKHRVQTFKSSMMKDEDEPWNAWAGDLVGAIGEDSFGTGRTEDDAIVAWAQKNNVRLWNEE